MDSWTPLLKYSKAQLNFLSYNDCFITDTNLKSENITHIRRFASAGFFEVRNQADPSVVPDVFPPSDVKDLTLISLDRDNNIVTLQWTASGDDFDQGIGYYIISIILALISDNSVLHSH